jgi:hypothetical protein
MDWEECARIGDARWPKKLKGAQRQKTIRSKKKLSRDAQKARLYHVLRGVARRLHKKDLKMWIQACGRFVSQKLGPVIYLKNLDIIYKVAKRPKELHASFLQRKRNIQKSDIIDLTRAGGQGTWAMRPLMKKVPIKIKGMKAYSEGIGMGAFKKVPRTVQQVEALLKVASKGTRKKKKKKKKKGRQRKAKARKVKKPSGAGYVKLWFLRARVTRSLYLARRKLQVGNATVAKLARIFPDSYRWLDKFSKALGLNPKNAKAQTLFDRIGYTGEPHIFSMWCCLFADVAMKCATPAELERDAKGHEKFAKAHRKKHKIWCHPAQAYVAVKKQHLKLKGRKKRKK